jgi:hypothetical protein
VFDVLFDLLHFGAIVGLVLLLFRPSLRERFERRCIGPATAVDLAWIRIVVCGVLVLYVLSEDLASQAGFGPEWFDPPGYSRWLGRGVFDWFHSAAWRLHALKWLTIVALGLGLAGVKTRVTIPIAAVLYFLVAALLRSFGKNFHEGYLGFYVLLVLCLVPCGDALSVDARRRREPPPPTSYPWACWACWAIASVPYLQLGLSKLISGGLGWFEGASLRNYMLVDNLNLHELDADLALRFIDAPVIFFTIAAFFAVLFELAYALVLISPRLRRVLPACVALLHLGIWLGQDALFLDAILIPMMFYVPARLRRLA